ncbi:Bug family tripartite tricarboxylate transporter substrate binding protein [Pararhodobacter oceanensis]|uniref:Tripartite tricarboxylate transporter substrate binding protein n=1 Tax=Pararhodobacter oceanensis TaxID=2172121 RepID=A0A2T8HTZ2_9RHOB|nr:tripartite tricarboxylate transporter substrate binding protein [Pararhodobacter oceanensis]PVH28919.1 tripartite tricarboxylate transporter substrate binding protein [Pararhodobacter oceanensis]
MKNLALVAALGLSALAMPALADDYPQRDIDLVVPFAPGGSVDTTSRIIAETANSILEGGELVVVNRGGGGGIVGQTSVSMAAPDGYSILAMTSSVVTNPLMKGATYSIDDFRPVALYNLDPEVIAVPMDSPFETAQDFIDAATAEPLSIVVAGIGTSHHLSGLAIERVTDMTFNYIPTSGFGAQVQAVVGGHADGALWPMGEAMAQAQAGGVRLLAIAQEERNPDFPDVPTFQEAGIDIPIFATFRGWAVPAGTPDDVVATLSNLMQSVYEDEAYRERMTNAGFVPVFRDADAFQAVISDYATRTGAIIEEAGLGQ